MHTLIINIIVSLGAEFAQTENMQIAAKCECYKGYIAFFSFKKVGQTNWTVSKHINCYPGMNH